MFLPCNISSLNSESDLGEKNSACWQGYLLSLSCPLKEDSHKRNKRVAIGNLLKMLAACLLADSLALTLGVAIQNK